MTTSKRRNPRTIRARRRLRPSLMVLEDRTLLASLLVANTDDSGTGSLRYEISQASNNDTITFDPALFSSGPRTITLTSGILNITNDLTIQGPGATLLTISGNNSQGVFDVTAPGSPSPGATLSGLTIANGKNSGGGGIHNEGTLTLTGCTVSGNKAPNAPLGVGGGIDNLGTLTLIGCTVSGNKAIAKGGGISNYGTLTITGGDVSNNSTGYAGYGGNGGGIYSTGFGALTLTGCTVSGNTANNSGGGLNLNGERGTATLTGCTVSNNSAKNFSGGGIELNGQLTLTGCTVKDNSSGQSGGGIDNQGTLTLTDCTVSGNTAASTTWGGGILNRGTGATLATLKLTDSTVSGNTSYVGGGIANLQGAAVMTNCTVSGNTATNKGGGLYNNTGTLTLTNCTVESNTAVDSKHLSPGFGGGICNYSGTATLTNCTLVGNGTPLGGKGGDILNSPGSNFTLNNSIVAYSTSGGDIAGTVSGNNNIIDDAATAGGLSPANGNILSTNLLLAAPGNYGGPTKTVALFPGSPAINKGDNSLIPPGVTTDQRGAPRINGGTVDIGAVESGATTIVVTTLADEDNGGIDPALGSGTSLREAIAFANVDPYRFSGDTITFAAGLKGTIALSNALPAIAANVPITGPGAGVLTIDGPGAGVLTIDGRGASDIPSINARASGILSINARANVTVSGLTLAHGKAKATYYSDSGIVNNTTYGGGIFNGGTLTLTGCTVSGSSATFGGGIWNGGTLTLTGCTVSGNSAFNEGGGIGNSGTLTLTDCTVSGNKATAGIGFGGGIGNTRGTLTLTDCTVSGNSAPQSGGGIFNGGTVTLNNTIVANSTSGGDIFGLVSGNNNLIDDSTTAGGLTNDVNGNLVGVNPMLGALGDNGGPTQTMALLAGSPAIDAGDNSLIPQGVTTDQRGAARIKGAAVDIGAFESGRTTIVVTTLTDEDNGGIDPAIGSGTSLREAIAFVNGVDPGGGDTITFAAGLKGTLALTQGALPAIAPNVVVAIDGPGANVLTVDGQLRSGILSIESGANVGVFRLTLAHGKASSSGGAVSNAGGAVSNAGTLTMTQCTVAGNTAPALGGGVLNAGTLTMVGCTVAGNTASDGGGIYNYGLFHHNGALTLTNCTVAGNTATAGGGINNTGALTLTNCTVAGNTAPFQAGGIANGGSVTLDNTIVAGDTGGDIGSSVTLTGSSNLVGDGSGSGLTGTITGDPKLGPLAWNGGPTQTMALLAGSPAINKGDNTLVPLFVATDQRGASRIKGAAVDIGAFESGAETIVVTTLTDEDNGSIDPFVGAGTSLREAIDFANTDPSGDTITFAPHLKGAIDLSDGPLPAITTNMTIAGPGANVLTIDGQGSSGILSINAGANAAVSGLTLAHGKASSSGGAVSNAGMLTMTDCTVSGSTAAGSGGGVSNAGTLTMTNCTVAGNTATSNGGGIDNATGGTLMMTDCTVASNTATAGGGAVSNAGTLTMTNCTVAGNTAIQGGGINNTSGGSATLNDTIVAGDTGGDIGSSVTLTGSSNLVGDGSGSGLTGTITGDPKLGPLAWNGGPTQTMALLAGSPAIGAGAALSIKADQRGFALDSPPDIGAFQYQGPPPTVTISGPATGVVQVEGTFTLTATDPTPADQNGKFTYTIDWNGNGTDVQIVQGSASLQVMHAYNATGSYTPIVTVLDQDHRSSSPTALAAPVVVTALTPQIPFVTSQFIQVNTLAQASNVINVINNFPAQSWMSANSVNVTVTGAPFVDTRINPTSPNAQINVSGPANYLAPLFSVNNPYGGASQQGAATVAVAVAAALIGGAAIGSAGTLAATNLSAFIIPGSATYVSAFVEASGIVAASITSGLVAGTVVGGAVGGTSYVAAGASPALVVDQGTVTWSNCVLSTVTDSPTILVKGGTLILQNDFIEGTPAGSQPVIEVDGGTLILGAPDGTEGNQLGAFGSAPFVRVTGAGRVIVEGGNTFDQIASDLTFQAAGSTVTQLVSSAPVTVPGQMVTFTATVTASGAPENGGSVEFLDATTKTYLGTVALSNGSAALQFTPNAFTVGDTIIATYLPTSGSLQPSSGQVTQAVLAATTTALAGPTSTPVYGQPATFTATVTDITPSGGTPTGSVEFYDGQTDLGPGSTLSGSGSAATSTFTTAALTAQPHSIRAVYTPSGTFQTSTATLDQTVKPAAITTSLSSSANPAVPLQSVTYTATVNNASGTGVTPVGTVQFKVDGSNLGDPVSLDASGHATSQSVSFPAGPGHTINAFYIDPKSNFGSSNTTLTQTVLSPGVSVSGTTLYIVGGSTSSDSASVIPAGKSNTGSTGVTVTSTIKGVSSTATTGPLTSIVLAGYAGNETFTLASTLTLATTITAGDGNDIIQLGAGDSTVTLGNGNDKVTASGKGNDTVTLGNGNDTVILGDGDNTVTVGNGNDTIQLGNGSNVVVEGTGTDSVKAGNGNNFIVGGLGPGPGPQPYKKITVGNGTNILIDGSATVQPGDSFRQILNAWVANPIASNQSAIRSRFTVNYNQKYPNYLSAGSGIDWFFYKPPATSNKKLTDFLN